MPADDQTEPEPSVEHLNRLETDGGAGDVVQARDVHGGVHFHQSLPPFPVTPRQLPGPPHGFVNRQSELIQLAKVAVDEAGAPRLVIIAGTAGVGKTSLALRWAHTVRSQFPDGQLYTNLRGYDPGTPATPDHVLGGFLRALGVPARALPSGVDDRAALYRSILADRRVLVLLDNAATAGQLRPLLPGAAGCLTVVTSRSRLSGLVAREGARRLQLDLLSEDDAVELLGRVVAGYRTADERAEQVELARLCARLPLALRIAGERAASRPLMPLAELIADLRDESGLWDALSTDRDDAEADAVRTVFAWSYRALPESAARMFRFLGLFPGDEFSSPVAAALAGSSTWQARRDLDALVGAHLVEDCGHDRYQFHDLLRAYANDQLTVLESEHERTEARRRVLTWYLHSADAAQQQISPFECYQLDLPSSGTLAPARFDSYHAALSWYRTESGNLVAAVRAAAAAGEHGITWRLSAVMRAIQMHQNAFDEWITTARIGAESAAVLGELAGEAEALDSLGKALFQSRVLAEAGACHRRALGIRRDLGDRFGVAVSLNALGLWELRQRRLTAAASYFAQGEAVFNELGERRWVALLRANRAETLCERGDYPEATDLLHGALAVLRDVGDRYGLGNAQYLLAWALRAVGRPAEARSAIDLAIEIATSDDIDMRLAHWLAELARIELAQDEPGEALVSSQRSAVIQRRLGDRSREAIAIDLTGQAYQHLDRHDEAAKFHRRAAAVHREFNDPWQLANSLANLATALDHLAEPDEARSCRREATALLGSFDDPVAAALRQRLSEDR
ncbi:tetratricopeptide repeat protein [Natronosporangium hydrolyticum]|uniref:Tetratricopeptide repeat protein n=1 Tax=Natronosporangium hydrolyticum TaxID=2811111 RepID=A0A895YCD8_9ACTN|nr:tetratricopeptide repeat protein [Natronosporangium hydrolyticum]QSB13103.1 tetratricopeptide repeat protein [Natronosporangium hydrolyticum]